MRKTTEELWKEAGGNSLTDYGVECAETFRRLVIENERECAEAVGYLWELVDVDSRCIEDGFIRTSELNEPPEKDWTPLFTFPPAAQVPECSKCANRGKLDGLSQEFYCDSCKYSKTWLDDNFAAAPEVKHA